MPTFIPPTVRRPIPSDNPVISRLSIPLGMDVLKVPDRVNGYRYESVVDATADQVASAEFVYTGGRVHTITDEEAAALTAAGYEVIYD